MGRGPVPRGEIAQRTSANVRSLRIRRGWSLEEMSRRLGDAGRPMLPTSVSKIEQGDRRMDVDDLAAFAVAFGVPPGSILGEPSRGVGEDATLTVAMALQEALAVLIKRLS